MISTNDCLILVIRLPNNPAERVWNDKQILMPAHITANPSANTDANNRVYYRKLWLR